MPTPLRLVLRPGCTPAQLHALADLLHDALDLGHVVASFDTSAVAVLDAGFRPLVESVAVRLVEDADPEAVERFTAAVIGTGAVDRMK